MPGDWNIQTHVNIVTVLQEFQIMESLVVLSLKMQGVEQTSFSLMLNFYLRFVAFLFSLAKLAVSSPSMTVTFNTFCYSF